uniref:Uncharacterized protein n=1 Tax=Babesia bovis TaxID=5865 RepID=S6B9L4_BABBO|nr:hypothetical protein [Babesia bovis]
MALQLPSLASTWHSFNVNRTLVISAVSSTLLCDAASINHLTASSINFAFRTFNEIKARIYLQTKLECFMQSDNTSRASNKDCSNLASVETGRI